ncbi:MAG: hypothetical protein IPM71_03265 [Bacteroidota bacterium]|nr:MAG: hypothetical protein IPM71_03265 [Bacteroidota bacterium]
MLNRYYDYSLFQKFFEAYSQAGIEGIISSDNWISDLGNSLEMNRQLFYISDVILMDMLYVSKGITTLFGKAPEQVTQGFFLTTTHPDDYDRHQLARTKLISLAQELFIQKGGQKIMSANFRAKRHNGVYFNALYQANLFYSKVPYESVFLNLVLTDISEIKNTSKGFHFYSGDNPAYFRFPDNELFMTTNRFSNTEFAIIKLIDDGNSSLKIAEKLFRSHHTINTHRTNILKKSGKLSIYEVIHDLRENGLL